MKRTMHLLDTRFNALFLTLALSASGAWAQAPANPPTPAATASQPTAEPLAHTFALANGMFLIDHS